MLYNNDFVFQSPKVEPLPLYRNPFTVTLYNENKTDREKTNSIARAFKPLLCFSAIFAMSPFRYNNSGLIEVNKFDKLYCLFALLIYIFVTVFISPSTWHQLEGDLPLTILSKTFTVLLTFEIIYDIFIISFGNSVYYINLLKVIQKIDEHYRKSKTLNLKRRILASCLTFIPVILMSLAILFAEFRITSILMYTIFIIINHLGSVSLFFIIIIYTQVVSLNKILRTKVDKMSPSKESTFKDGVFKSLLNRLLVWQEISTSPFSCSYCWFELMQIYDKIADCIYIFNKIYAVQILLMYNTWLLSTIIAICRFISPTLKNTYSITTEMYHYIIINLRLFILTKMSQYLIQEWQKSLSILIHILVYQDLNKGYVSQIKTMIELLNTRKIQLSAVVCPVTIKIFASFIGRIIFFTVLLVQHCYINN